MIVLIPLNHPELLIFDGIGGLIGKLPIIGPIVTNGIIEVLRKKKEPYSQPNRLLQKHIVPELIESIIPKQTAQKILSYIESDTEHQTIQNYLQTIKKPDSVSLKICQYIFQTGS